MRNRFADELLEIASGDDKIILLLIILICILSDIGGFLFGKYFKGVSSCKGTGVDDRCSFRERWW